MRKNVVSKSDIQHEGQPVPAQHTVMSHLERDLGSVGIAAGGRSHDIDFDTMFTGPAA